MTPPQYLILPRTKPGRAASEATRRAEICEFDLRIIRNARVAIQRSRKLLEETKHQVRTPR